MRQRRRRQARIEPDEPIGFDRQLDASVRRSACSTGSRAASTISDGATQRMSSRDRAGVDARHLQNVLEQARQPIDFGEDQLALLAPLLLVRPRRLQVARGDADGGQRRSQVVAERGEERGFQLLALPRQFGALALVEELRALDRDRRQPARASSVPGSSGRPAAASSPIGFVPRRSGTSAHAIGR